MSQEPSTASEDSTRINPANEATFRALKNITSKSIQCEHHIELLEEHLIKGTTPKGLVSTLQPSVPFTDTDLLIQWERIKLDFQSKLILALCEYWKRYKTKLNKDQSKLEKTLKANSVETEWTRMEEILDKVKMTTKERFHKRKTNPPIRGEQENSSGNKSGEGRRRPLRRRGERNQNQD
jgi:hypothetical protein